MLRDGRCQEVADLLASLEEHEPRYARDVATRLDVAKRWLDAGDSPAAKADFWEWMDREG
ncbi:MAG: hypothetical protein HY675_27955 [Chloroflexi bacterium]|nr:hypothetical protein [Candidatus Methylomirabilis oxyfera]MBI4322345.1 hypothetical protein [Chloroflexota bacterium]